MRAATALKQALRKYSLARHLALPCWRARQRAEAGAQHHVGLEVDIPGFDPLKVGACSIRGRNRGGGRFSIRWSPSRQGSHSRSSRCRDHSEDTKLWTFKLGPASNS